MAILKIQKTAIDVPFYYKELKDPKYGGIVTFSGTVREWTGDVQTDRIEYTAYEEMALKEMAKLAETVEADGSSVIMVHRIGVLELMEEAVFIGVASPHRKEAFKHCQYLIDELKVNVPIWKKEIDQDQVRWGGIADESNR